MSTTMDNELSDQELTTRLRATFATVMPLLLDAPPSAATHTRGVPSADSGGLVVDLDSAGSPPSRRRIALLGAAATVAFVVTGLALAQGDPAQEPAQNQSAGLPMPPDQRADGSIDYEIAPPAGSVPLSCDQNPAVQCSSYADLPVARGVSDFYVGPERLGTAVVSLEEFGRLVRCVALDVAGTMCERLEGFAGVPLARYPSEVTVDTSGALTSNALDVEIGTTFTDITPIDYARQWSNHADLGDPAFGDVVVRGHAGVTFSYASSRYVVWAERPGVLVWVKAAGDAPDDLLAIAEGVRRVPGPPSIPWVVSVLDEEHGRGYDASDNDADALLIGKRSDGAECVGFGYIESACTGAISEQTFVEIIDERALVTGIAPATVTAVRISQNDNVLVETPTRTIDVSSNLLFGEYVDAEGLVTVEWIADNGVVASIDIEIDFCRTACG